jgi:predicted cupin superfamily sugar epimerase
MAVGEGISTEAEAWIKRLRLARHPEGGWYREEHRSPLTVRRGDGLQRPALTLIWFLLTASEISQWHRVLGADETWHHAGGAPLELWLLPPAGGTATRLVLGPLDTPVPPAPRDPGDVSLPVRVVPAGWWQAARTLGDWSLLTCCVGPGFDFADFQLLHSLPPAEHPPGARSDLL